MSGYATSGKDTVADLLCYEYDFERFSFSEPLQDMLMVLDPKLGGGMTLRGLVNDEGWTKAKENPEVRRLLQVLGTEIGRDMISPNLWVNLMAEKIAGVDRVVLTNVRFPNEAEMVRNRGGLILRVERPGVGPAQGHISDLALDEFDFDRVISNDSTIENLHHYMRGFMDRL